MAWVVIVLVCWSHLSGQAVHTTRSDSWKAKYELGTLPIKTGTKLLTGLDSEALSFSSKELAPFEVPVKDIRLIVYDNTVHNRAVWWIKSGHWITTSGPYLGPGILLSGAYLAIGALALAPFGSKKHYVHVLWEKKGDPEMVVIELGKKRYPSFLESLQKSTGTQWRNLPAERKLLKEELRREKDNSIALNLRRNVQTATGELEPGRYQIVCLEREEGLGELYFFEGKKVQAERCWQ
jgi:hypothetical protein